MGKGEGMKTEMCVKLSLILIFTTALPAGIEGACMSGDMNGCYQLGRAYLDGSGGFARDAVTGKKYIELACDAGVQKACETLEALQGTPKQEPSYPERREEFTNDTGGESSVNVEGSESFNTYTIPVTRGGLTREMAVGDFWSGEYPRPVIYVEENGEHRRKIRGYTSLREPLQQKSCTIKTGIYHPWSKERTSVANFYTILPKVDYRVKRDTVLGEHRLHRGDLLENEIYLAEGSCLYRLNGKEQITEICVEEAMDDPTVFRKRVHPGHRKEQWLRLRCDEGYTVFVRDRELLRQHHVRRGKISGYGKVTR